MSTTLPGAYVPSKRGATAEGAFAHCPHKYRLIYGSEDTTPTGSSLGEAADVGTVVHYALARAFENLRDVQQGRAGRWLSPWEQTKAAMAACILPVLDEPAMTRAQAAFGAACPDFWNADSAWGTVLAVEQPVRLYLGEGVNGSEWYTPTVDLITIKQGPVAPYLMMPDHKCSAKPFDAAMRLHYEMSVQFVGMAAMGEHGFYLVLPDDAAVEAAERAGYAVSFRGSKAMAWVPSTHTEVMVHLIGSHPPHRAPLIPLLSSPRVVASLRQTLLDNRVRRAQYAAAEAANPAVGADNWPRAMGMACHSPFRDKRCDQYEACTRAGGA